MTWARISDDEIRGHVDDTAARARELAEVTATPELVEAFADEHGPELTDWQCDVVALAYRTGDDERPAQRPHKRRRRPLVGATVRWGRCVAYGGVGGVLVGLIVGLR